MYQFWLEFVIFNISKYQFGSLSKYESISLGNSNILNYKVSVHYQSVKVSVRNVSVRFYLQP